MTTSSVESSSLGGLSARGRYLRFVGLTRATEYGYFFWPAG
ncbi:hypothetical protein [Kribbella sp. NPDC023855]